MPPRLHTLIVVSRRFFAAVWELAFGAICLVPMAFAMMFPGAITAIDRLLARKKKGNEK